MEGNKFKQLSTLLYDLTDLQLINSHNSPFALTIRKTEEEENSRERIFDSINISVLRLKIYRSN